MKNFPIKLPKSTFCNWRGFPANHSFLYFLLTVGCTREVLSGTEHVIPVNLIDTLLWLPFSFSVCKFSSLNTHCFSPGGRDRISMECIANSYSGFARFHRIGGLPSRVRKIEVFGCILQLICHVMWLFWMEQNSHAEFWYSTGLDAPYY